MAENETIFRELGVTGLKTRNGQVEEEYLPDLRGAKGRKALKEMASTDPTVGAILYAIKQVIKSAVWRVDPAGDSDLDKEAASFIFSNMHDMSLSWNEFISELCSEYIYGWALFEIVWKKRKGRKADPKSQYNDGAIGVRKLAIRGQNTLDKWQFDENGGVKGMWQSRPLGQAPLFIPIEKSLLFNTDSRRGNPEGRSILANAYTSYYYASKIKPIEAIGIERDLNGLPMLRVPIAIITDPNNAAIYQTCKDLVVNVRRDEQEGLLIPYDKNNPDAYEFSLLSSSGKRQIDTNEVINRYKIEIAQTVSYDFIFLGHGSIGSYALARAKSNAAELAILAQLDSIEGVLNSHLIPRLIEINPRFNGIVKYPRIKYSIAKIPTLSEISQIITSLAKANVNVAESLDIVNHVLNEAGLPPLTISVDLEDGENEANNDNLLEDEL